MHLTEGIATSFLNQSQKQIPAWASRKIMKNSHEAAQMF